MDKMDELRLLEDQGLVTRIDLEGTNGDPSEIVKNVRARLKDDWFLAHPGAPSNLMPGEDDPGARPNYSAIPVNP